MTRTRQEFLIALLVVWTVTVGLAGGLLTWFPQLLLKKGYDAQDVILVTATAARTTDG